MKKPVPLEPSLPSSMDAEKAILGAILLDNSSYLTAINLEAEDFCWDSHSRIYQRMTDLMADGKPVDFTTLTEILKQHKELEAVGGLTYVTNLTDGLPRVKNISSYVTILKEKAKLRNLIYAANKIIENAYEQSDSAEAIVTAAEKSIARVAEHEQEVDESKPIFATVSEFTKDTPNEIDWLVEGVIERGANGLIVSTPKFGKSVVSLDLAVALAMGQSWMPGLSAGGFYIPKQVKVGFCAREDAPGLTRWQETPRLMLDEPGDMRHLIAAIEKRKIEFVVLDVFRRLHSADENDPNEMQKIIDAVCDVQAKTGAQICLIHHKRKEGGDRGVVTSLTDSARGSSVIAGYAEFIIGGKIVNPTAPKHDWVRELEVELKAAIAPENWYCKFVDKSEPKAGISVERCFWEPPKKGRKKADNLAANSGQQQLPVGDRDDTEAPF